MEEDKTSMGRDRRTLKVYPHPKPNPVKIAAATHMAGAYNLKKVLPRHVLQRRQPSQIDLPAGTLEWSGDLVAGEDANALGWRDAR